MNLHASQLRQVIAGDEPSERQHGTTKRVALTQRMRETLETAAHNPLRRLHDNQPGKPAWPAHPATLTALERRDLIAKSRRRTRKGWWLDEWTITDTGRALLQPAESRSRNDTPRYLAGCGSIRYRKLKNNRWSVATSATSSGDYTSDPSRSIDYDQPPDAKRTVAVEVIVTDDHLKQYASQARTSEAKRGKVQGRELDAQSVTQRLAQVRMIARERYVDFSKEERYIRYLIAKGRTTAAATNLTRAETLLRQRV